MFDDAVFADRFLYLLTMVLIGLSRLLHADISYEIDTAKIIVRFFRISYCQHDLIRLNSIVCHVENNKMYDDAVSADRFRYQLTMFGIGVLIGLSRLLHAHIAYDSDPAKIIAAFFRISYCLHDLIRLNSFVCHVQRARCTIMWFSVIDSDIN